MKLRGAIAAAALLALAGLASAQPATPSTASRPAPVTLHAISFDGGWNLPLWAAQRNGDFAGQGIVVQLSYTPSSAALVSSLFDGRNDIALALFDNLVAYDEGQGEAKIEGTPDLVTFMAGDGGFLSVVAAPDVRAITDLRGRTLSVDAMTTGAAFVLRELVARGGVAEGDVRYERAGGTANRYQDLLAGKHAATLLRTPFEVLAQSRGFNVLASAESLGPYAGTVGYVRRGWAQAHAPVVVGFLKAYKAGMDFVADPANRAVAEALLVAHIRDMTPELAHRSYDLLLDPRKGLARDLKPDARGMATVLALRGKYAVPQKALGEPARYVDWTWYDAAFGGH
jgi:ABC-type nitrate/sulfonate/bicarbonate transport system substrate-binding protein